jgi:hypothetical protein
MSSFDDAFDTVRNAWRLEARDDYNVPGTAERLAEFDATGQVAPSPGWTALLTDARARGARIGRVRLVGYPYTRYTRYELAAYAHSVAAGEDVQLVDRRWLDDTWDVAPDFWLIDGQVWLMRYDTGGVFLAADHVDDPAPYQQLRDLITSVAVPLAEFQLTDIPQPRTETAVHSLPPGLLLTR